MTCKKLKLGLGLVALVLAGVSPNLFVIAQAGYAKLSVLGLWVLLPSIAGLAILAWLSPALGYPELRWQILHGARYGLVAAVGLEVVRLIGFRLGGMPGEMPRLLGVLLLDRFSQGPNILSDVLGWLYHFWNGASFGIVYVLLFGRPTRLRGILYALAVAVGFLSSPAVVAMGVGRFGSDFGIGFPLTVVIAHLVYGYLLGLQGERGVFRGRPVLCELREWFDRNGALELAERQS